MKWNLTDRESFEKMDKFKYSIVMKTNSFTYNITTDLKTLIADYFKSENNYESIFYF